MFCMCFWDFQRTPIPRCLRTHLKASPEPPWPDIGERWEQLDAGSNQCNHKVLREAYTFAALNSHACGRTLFVSLRDSFTPSLPHIQVSTCTHTLRVTHRRITATCWRLMVDDLRCGSLAAAPLPLCGTMPCVFERARCSVTICSSLVHAGALRDFILQEVVTASLALRLYHCQLGSAVVASKLPGFVFDMMDKTRAKKKKRLCLQWVWVLVSLSELVMNPRGQTVHQ